MQRVPRQTMPDLIAPHSRFVSSRARAHFDIQMNIDFGDHAYAYACVHSTHTRTHIVYEITISTCSGGRIGGNSAPNASENDRIMEK